MRAAIAATDNTRPLPIRIKWRVSATAHGWEQQARQVDWFALSVHDGALLVKENPQRQVWRLPLAGRDYFAKLYRPATWSDRCRRHLLGPNAIIEWDALESARRLQILAVRPVACGTCRNLDVLITESVTDAVPLSTAWMQGGPDQNKIIRATAQTLARAHNAGFAPRDNHPGNFLVHSAPGPHPAVLFVDLYGAATLDFVSPQAAAIGLAHLDQWFVRRASRTQQLKFLRAYLQDRFQAKPERSTLRQWAATVAQTRQEWSRRLALRRDRRLHRAGKYFTPIKSRPWQGTAVTHLRDGGGLNLPRPIEAAMIRLVERLSNSPNPWEEIGAIVAPGFLVQRFGPQELENCARPRRLFHVGHQLRNRNIASLPPVAYLERCSFGRPQQGLLIMQDAEEVAFLDTWIDRRPDWPRNIAIESAGALLAEAEAVGLVWPDPYPDNLIWNSAGTAAFLRFDGMRVRRSHAGRITQAGIAALALRLHLSDEERAILLSAYHRRRRRL